MRTEWFAYLYGGTQLKWVVRRGTDNQPEIFKNARGRMQRFGSHRAAINKANELNQAEKPEVLPESVALSRYPQPAEHDWGVSERERAAFVRGVEWQRGTR